MTRAYSLLLIVTVVAWPGLSRADDAPLQRPRPSGQTPGVYKDRIVPHWFAGDSRFWYRNDLKGGTKEFVLVDAGKGTREPAFDHAKLAAGLSKATEQEYRADRLPFDTITFGDDGKAVRFRAASKTWACNLETYKCTSTQKNDKDVDASDDMVPSVLSPDSGSRYLDEDTRPSPPTPLPEGEGSNSPFQNQQPDPRRRPADGEREVTSPDGKWIAFIKDHNVCIRPKGGGDAIPLSKTGVEGNSFGMLSWSPDSKALAGFRIEPAEIKEVYLVESSPQGGGRAKLSSRPYALPGDKFTAYEPWVFDPAAKTAVKVETERIDFGRPRIRWSRDGRHFTYEKVDRGHQRFRLVEVDARDGTLLYLIDEKTDTFIWTAHTETVGNPPVTFLEKTNELIYTSEKDGWRHLYLVDANTGVMKPVTQGDWVVRGIDRIDESARQVWFRASGRETDQDPYFIHHYRINFDGTGLTALTAGNGTHTVQFSPDRKYLIDAYSRVDQAQVHELRRVADGKLVVKLEEADIADLKAGGWEAPEVFSSKGRDDKTDIWGIVCRPKGFDPAKKYPVIEYIYAGPQGSFVPKSFSPFRRFANLTDLGFVVVQIDGMGTANRSKAFHDVCWKNLKDAGFPDRVLWHKAVAAKYPWYDISRVGIHGGSAGGQNAAAAVLFHGDFYKAAVAGCGCHDNRMDKASWNEQWMGYPVGPQYAANSNIDNANRLRGKLMLIVGEMDTNVPPESTYRLCDALIRAGKDFDFILVPGAGHGMGGAYGTRRLQDFFIRHLQGIEPPDRNAQPPRKAAPAAPLDNPVSAKLAADAPNVTAPPESFFEKYPDGERETARKFYAKHVALGGLSIAAAEAVADEALLRAHYLFTHLLAGRPDVLEAMTKAGTRLIVIGKDQVYTDMPEYRASPNPTYLNERVRGTGGLRVTSFGEENLLNLPLDRYDDESIAIHEFCHTIDAALARIDPSWKARLARTYRNAMDKGLWKNTYTASNAAEYWAEICQSYFDCNRINNWNHGPIGTREELKDYDPEGYELVRITFNLKPADDWRYVPLRRQPSVIAPPDRFHINAYYTKFTLAREFPIIGSARASDEALLKANDTVRKMFTYRHDVLKAIIAKGVRLVVLSPGEKLSDLPEFRHLADKPGIANIRYWDHAADGETKFLIVPEENVLGLPGDPLPGRSAVLAAMARATYVITASRPVDPEFDQRRDKQQYELRVKRLDIEFGRQVKELHEAAVGQGLWKGTPAIRDPATYWTSGVEAYFDVGGRAVPNGADHPIATREALQRYDPDLYALVDDVMAYRGHVDWRAKR